MKFIISSVTCAKFKSGQMVAKKRFLLRFFISLTLFFVIFTGNASANEHEASEKYNPKETTFHHLLDNYDWEFESLGKIHLPRILYHSSTGLAFFGSTKSAVKAGWIEAHEFIHDAGHGELLVPTAIELKVEQAKLHQEGGEHHGDDKAFAELVSNYQPLDFSITKNVLYVFFAAALLMFIFLSVAKAYKNKGVAPSGMQNLFETIIVFIRDDVAKFNIGHHYEKYMPLLLTQFFFIWFLNLLGMTPFSANVTGNISVTLSLALVTLAFMLVKANGSFWGHTLNPPGVPFIVKLILVPVEILGIFTKPFALMMRLFANITAGHVIMISLMGLIFIFGKNGENVGLGYGVGIFSSLFIIAISMLELFVALLQAYVFTMLTAVFIGQVTAEADHH